MATQKSLQWPNVRSQLRKCIAGCEFKKKRSLYRLPKTYDGAKIWLDKLGININPKDVGGNWYRLTVCERHFSSKMKTPSGLRLTATAVPDRNLPLYEPQNHFRERVSKAQKQKLIELVQLNYDIIYRLKGECHRRKEKWNYIAAELNCLGPQKTSIAWQKCWTDLQLKVKKKLLGIRRRIPTTGVCLPLTFTEEDVIIISMGGLWKDYGMQGPAGEGMWYTEQKRPYPVDDIPQTAGIFQDDSNSYQSSAVISDEVKIEPESMHVQIIEPTNYDLEFNIESPVKTEIKEEPFEVNVDITDETFGGSVQRYESSTDITLRNRLSQWASRIGIKAYDFDDLLTILMEADVDISKNMNPFSEPSTSFPSSSSHTSINPSNIFTPNLAHGLKKITLPLQKQYIEDNHINTKSQAAIGEILTQVRSIQKTAEIRYTKTMQEFTELNGGIQRILKTIDSNICQNLDSPSRSDGIGEIYSLKSKEDMDLAEALGVSDPNFKNRMVDASDFYCRGCGQAAVRTVRRRFNRGSSNTAEYSSYPQNQSDSEAEIVIPEAEFKSETEEVNEISVDPEVNSETVENESLQIEFPLPNYRRAANTSHRCIFSNCKNSVRYRVAREIRERCLFDFNFYVPEGARICVEHLQKNSWDQLYSSDISISRFTPTQVEDAFSIVNSLASRPRLDFENIDRINCSELHYWVGLTHEQFNRILNEVPSLRFIKKGSTALAILLTKLRTKNSSNRIATLFNMTRSTLERYRNKARDCMLQEFVPKHLELLSHAKSDILRNHLSPNEFLGNHEATAEEQISITVWHSLIP